MSGAGLGSLKAQQLLKDYGYNRLPETQSYSALKLFLSQFKSILIVTLLFAGGLSFAAGDNIDGILILAIVFLNSALGFWQEFKASKEIAALKKIEVEYSRVVRDGKEQKIPAAELVPGDLIILEAGDKIPADAILLTALDFSVNESSLTGESLPVVKIKENLIFLGSSVVTGKAKAKIEKTGADTRFGKIALTLGAVVEEPTPLEKSLSNLAKKVGIFAIAAAILIFFARALQGFEILEVFFTSTALMVAAVPEGLPAAISIILAIGVSRMYKKKALIRKMASIESLGATTIICTDKTGTLTKNEMHVKQIFQEGKVETSLVETAVLCNSASLVLKEDRGSFDILGDSTEGALLLWANDKKVNIESLKKENKIKEELPFSLKTRMMAVLTENENVLNLYTKGAPEVILSLCKISKAREKVLIEEYEKLASRGLRVLGFAHSFNLGKNATIQKKLSQKDLNFLGFVGIADAVREEAKEAILKSKNAGIKVVMITGDNELTARVIAEELGLIAEGEEVITGLQIDELTDEELARLLINIRVFARVTPEHKLRIVNAYQSLGQVVAVTGDGVNDALALKQAQVGVAMGQKGTDVAKEAADLVILDDNFTTIVSAVEEGRLVYSNILKVIKFLMAGNLAEVLVIVVAVVANLPTPLLPVQILWINFVGDGIPALSLAFDPSHKGIMHSSPRKNPNVILNKDILYYIGIGGTAIAAITIFVYFGALSLNGIETARGLTFSTLVFLQMAFIFIVRGKSGIFSNKFLLFSVLLVVVFQILIMTYPPLSELFKV